MSETNGAGAVPAEADAERAEIERIKDLLREKVREAPRNRDGRFFGKTLSQAGRDLLGEIDAIVEQELAAIAEGEASK